MKATTHKFLSDSLKVWTILIASLGYGQTTAWINEIHYDNNGADMNEGIEIVIENPDNLHLYELYLYKSDGTPYSHIFLDNSGITVGSSSGNFSFFTWNPSTGIQNGPADGIVLTYNGNVVTGQFLSYEGTITAVEGPALEMTSIDIGTTESNSTFFYESLQLMGTGSGYSDFSWNAPTQSTFGEINSGQTLGGVTGNAFPVIFNLSQIPVEQDVTPSDLVNVSAEIIDTDGISAVILYWGTSSGDLPNSIAMNLVLENNYQTSSGIPAQLEGTQIFYKVEATDNNSSPASATSNERTYTVGAPATLGWQITDVDMPFFIDFETSVDNVNEGEFAGNGFQPFPDPGQLDSNSWAISGFSDGDLDFGSSRIVQNEDYTQGISSGNITPGGIYAFVIGSSVCLGFQPTGPDFTPGTITLRLQNKTDVALNELQVSYDIFVRNDQNRSNSFNFSYSMDNINFTNGSSMLNSQELPMDFPYWKKFPQSETITGISVEPEAYYYLRWTGQDETGSVSRDEFGLDNISLVANPISTEYVYNGDWLPNDPNGIADKNDNITIQSDTASFSEAIAVNNIQIANAAVLQVENVLKLHGTITNNGSLIFVSDATKLGQLAAAQTTGSISETTIQRYIPARRAFRFVSPAVTTTTSIHANWQEAADSNISNPHPGFGTHITGSLTDQTDGFDATGSGNPSLFLFNNSSQIWNDIENTDVNGLVRGKPYRLFVRGDRSVDLTDNETQPTNTILRATGNLALGDHLQNDLSQVADSYNFIGNPFQAIVNMNEVLENSTNLNPYYYYVWDPNMNTRGGYVTVALPFGVNSIASEANQFLQPGQAAFVRTLNAGETSILFEQNDKAPFQNATNVFRGMLNEETNASINLQMFEGQAFLNNDSPADGFRVNFEIDGNNEILPNDAPKMGNVDENIALLIGGNNYLSIANREMPVNEETIELFTNQYRYNNYIFKIELNGFPQNTTAFLKDDFLQIQTELINNTVNFIDFEVDENMEESMAPNRFSFLFTVNDLSANENIFPSITIYPNPVKNGRFFILLPKISSGKAIISLFNGMGQEVFKQSQPVSADQRIEVNCDNLPPGAYWVKVRSGGKIYGGKLLFF